MAIHLQIKPAANVFCGLSGIRPQIRDGPGERTVLARGNRAPMMHVLIIKSNFGRSFWHDLRSHLL